MKTKSSPDENLVRVHADDLRPPTAEELEGERRDHATRVIDFSDIPRVTAEEFERAGEIRRIRLGGKDRVTMFLDRDIVEAFRGEGPGYQTRINDALREFLLHRKPAPSPRALIGQAIRCLTLARVDLESNGSSKRRATNRRKPAKRKARRS